MEHLLPKDVLHNIFFLDTTYWDANLIAEGKDMRRCKGIVCIVHLLGVVVPKRVLSTLKSAERIENCFSFHKCMSLHVSIISE
jgi:hypothetical protein